MLPKSICIKETLRIDLNDYVFEGIDVLLISSIPGRYQIDKIKDRNPKSYGLVQVKQMLQDFYKTLSTTPHSNQYRMTAQTSSTGNTDKKYLNDIFTSFFPTPKLLEKEIGNPEKQFSLIFPTDEYIREESYGGVEYAAPLFFSEKL
eukprot:TRINITY_DN24274_c0_g1_i1.p2 TRINITY_DN24274_c0_g1~~TRINITY_DN24274_c0_g1_i1.p2  ORF type:complete len:147 (-),score=17.11 TRINITY_DN24274_c0_g1_i1:359-799(-)